jgi:hypothetical protein
MARLVGANWAHAESRRINLLEKAILRADAEKIVRLKSLLRSDEVMDAVESARNRMMGGKVSITYERVSAVSMALPESVTAMERIDAVLPLQDKGGLYTIRVSNMGILEKIEYFAGCMPKGGAIDLGCGGASDIYSLGYLGYSPVVGIDFSSAALERALRVNRAIGKDIQTIRFVRADFRAMPLKGAYDLIYAMNSLTMLGDKDIPDVVGWMRSHTSRMGINALNLSNKAVPKSGTDTRHLPSSESIEEIYLSAGWDVLWKQSYGDQTALLVRNAGQRCQ